MRKANVIAMTKQSLKMTVKILVLTQNPKTTVKIVIIITSSNDAGLTD